LLFAESPRAVEAHPGLSGIWAFAIDLPPVALKKEGGRWESLDQEPRSKLSQTREDDFFYEDISGDPYHIIPTDGPPHRADANPTYYGDSVGHWEGDKLMVDVINFVEDTWFGEDGYFHAAALHVTSAFSETAKPWCISSQWMVPAC
jgi:hypothetical protein